MRSGNPNPLNQFTKGHPRVGGRVKGKSMAERVKEMCVNLAPEMIEELHRLARRSRMDSVRVQAINAIMDRGLGKPKQAHTVEGNVAHTFQVLTHAVLFDDGDPVIEGTALPAISNGGSSPDDR